jgi:hypothetical protein
MDGWIVGDARRKLVGGNGGSGCLRRLAGEGELLGLYL